MIPCGPSSMRVGLRSHTCGRAVEGTERVRGCLVDATDAETQTLPMHSSPSAPHQQGSAVQLFVVLPRARAPAGRRPVRTSCSVFLGRGIGRSAQQRVCLRCPQNAFVLSRRRRLGAQLMSEGVYHDALTSPSAEPATHSWSRIDTFRASYGPTL